MDMNRFAQYFAVPGMREQMASQPATGSFQSRHALHGAAPAMRVLWQFVADLAPQPWPPQPEATATGAASLRSQWGGVRSALQTKGAGDERAVDATPVPIGPVGDDGDGIRRDELLRELLAAWNHHEDLRKRGSAIGELWISRQRLEMTRLQVRQVPWPPAGPAGGSV
ncbi:MAG: hypothetical protein GY939_16120 [Actinomycetia bacterium]|nr:hypothetical protein [Actinomycetes bacterium]